MAKGKRLFLVSGHLATDSDFLGRRYRGTNEDSASGIILFCSQIHGEFDRVRAVGLRLPVTGKLNLAFVEFWSKK